MDDLNLSKVKIEIIDNKELQNDEILKSNLSHLYDVMNKAIYKLPKEDQEKYFMNEEKINQIKESKDYRLL